MAQRSASSSRGKLSVDLKGNIGQIERSMSPISGMSVNEGIEMKSLNISKSSSNLWSKNGGFGSSGDLFETSSFSDKDSENINKEKNSHVGNYPREISVVSIRDSGKGKRSKQENSAWSNEERRSSYGSDSGRTTHQSLESSELALSPRSSISFSPTSGASGISDEDDLEYFCVDHMKLVSSKDAGLEHGECENIVPAFEWAEAQSMERDRRTSESLLTRFDGFAGIMIQERGEFKRTLTESKEDATDDFLDMIEDVITHILARQKEFVTKMDQIHDTNMKKINDQIKRCKKVQKETSTSLSQLSATDVGSEDYRKLKKRIQDKVPVYEEILRRDFNASTRLDYEFVPDPDAEQLFVNLKSLGDICIRPKPSKLPGFLSVSNEVDFSKRPIQNVSRSEGRSSEDKNSCCFSGGTFVANGRMILADWNNSCLKVFNSKGILVSKLDLPNNPWDVKTINDHHIVVTVPGEQKVFILQSHNEDLEEVSSFETDCECWGVAVADGNLVFTCDPWSKTPSVKVFSMSGKLLSFFQKDTRGDMLFSYPEHIATDLHEQIVYISDSRQNDVLAITIGGRMMWRYRHEKLVNPAGIATDSQGNLYICGKDSQNVHQVTKDGEFVRILLDKVDLENPRSICFERNGEQLIITDVAASSCDEFITAKLG